MLLNAQLADWRIPVFILDDRKTKPFPLRARKYLEGIMSDGDSKKRKHPLHFPAFQGGYHRYSLRV